MKSSRKLYKHIMLVMILTVSFFPNLNGQTSCCEDGFQPQTLVLQYTGDDCSATNTHQAPGTYTCSGDPADAELVYIIVNNRKNVNDGDKWFEGEVALNGYFIMDSRNGGQSRFRANAFIHVYDALNGLEIQTIEFHTSCSQPLVLNDQWGAFKLIGVTSRKKNLVCGNPLPVELLNFDLSWSNNDALLQWATATEENNSHFEIQRSSDGIEFTTIGNINSKANGGNSLSVLNYKFEDKQVRTDLDEIVYYRLKQVDFNGDFEFTDIELLTVTNAVKSNTIKVFPNPASTSVNVVIADAHETNALLNIKNLAGQTVATNELKFGQTAINIDITNLDRGIYYVEYQISGYSYTKKLIIDRE